MGYGSLRLPQSQSRHKPSCRVPPRGRLRSNKSAGPRSFVGIFGACSRTATSHSTMPSMVRAPDLLLAQDFAQALYGELGDNLLRVSLFGSRARRDHRAHSDYDFMIVLRDPTGSSRTAVHMQALKWELDRCVDLSTKILSSADFIRLRSGPDGFWRNFERDEQLLWPMTRTNA